MALSGHISIVDYIVFILGVSISLVTGTLWAYKDRRLKSLFHFHRAGGKLKALPVALSLLVTYESSIFFLGYPAEVYTNGLIYWLQNIGMLFGYSTFLWISIPLFYPLKVTSVFEYLQMRYDSLVIRRLATCLTTAVLCLYAGFVLFGASTALASVTGIPGWCSVLVLASIAIIYTALGGIAAVVVTDVFQGCVMLVSIAAVLIYGTVRSGGVAKVIAVNKAGGRLKIFDFDPNPHVRHTFWTLVVGNIFMTAGSSCSQMVIQRLNSTRSIQEARRVAYIAIPAFFILQTLGMLEGNVAFAYFSVKGCDPLASGQLENPTQIMSYFVSDLFKNVPGVTGLFLAALCSASLSTISSALSGISAMISIDVIKPLAKQLTDENLTTASKIAVCFFGALSISFAILISRTTVPISEIVSCVIGGIDGPCVAIFFVTIFCSYTTKLGIVIGAVAGLIFGIWLSAGYNFSPGRKRTPWLPLGPTDSCSMSSTVSFTTNASLEEIFSQPTEYNITENITEFNITSTGSLFESTVDNKITELDNFYSLSYMYLFALSFLVTVVTTLVASRVTRDENRGTVPEELILSPCKSILKHLAHIHCFGPHKKKQLNPEVTEQIARDTEDDTDPEKLDSDRDNTDITSKKTLLVHA